MNEQLEKIFGPNFKLRDIGGSNISNCMGLLSLNLLESNRLYSYMKSELELYYREKNKPVRYQTLHAEKSAAWKEHLYLNLQALLNEVTYTSDPQIKSFLVTKVYRWYLEKSQRPGDRPRVALTHPVKKGVEYPIVLQGIESTEFQVKHSVLPKIPKEITQITDESASEMEFPAMSMRLSAENSPARTTRSRRFFRPFVKSEHFPVVLDFRAATVGASPDTWRNTNYTDRESMDKTMRTTAKEVDSAKIPPIRREQIKEVGVIKRRLASKHLSLPIRVLESGLVFADFGQNDVPADMLPKGGELLIKDGGISGEGKGKKKKKKGKKTKESR
jgi:hypothetical protein